MAILQHAGTPDKPAMGTSGNDIMQGTAGDDYLYGAGGNDELYGGAGNDTLTAGQIYVSGSWRDDRLGDKLDGGAGNDTLFGGAGDDFAAGGEGDDHLQGGAGADTLEGGAGNDRLFGEEGNDKLDGGTGHDQLYGGAGDDFYTVRDRRTEIHDDLGKNSGIILADFVKPAENVAWTWGAGVQKLPYWIDALAYDTVSGIASELGPRHTVYYSFAQKPASWFTSVDNRNFTPFNAAQQELATKLLRYVSSVVDVNFVQTSDPEQGYTIVFGNNDQDHSAGYAAPVYGEHGTPLMLNFDQRFLEPSRDEGLAFTTVVLHEIGHALQLKHPFSHADATGELSAGPFLSTAEDLKSLSIMSYTYDAGVAGYTSYSPFDLAALHYAFGVAPGARAGNDTYVLDQGKMNMLWDGAGFDTIDGSAQSRDLVLDLRPGYWGYIGTKADLISAAGQVTVNFGTVIEAALGGSGNDTLTGNDANNVLTGGAGNDTLAGGAGIDIAAYAGQRSGYQVLRNGSGASVSAQSGGEGSDTLAGIERLKFADTMLALDTEGMNGQVYRLYQAAYDRKPDPAGLGYWIGMADQGMGLKTIAAAFTGGAEFAALYGANADHATFLTRLYANVLHRPYDQGGYDFWLNALKAGVSRDDVLIEFADSKENVANVAALIANGIEYTPFG
jgi:Ca2+-binding RTX toxin-like protein